MARGPSYGGGSSRGRWGGGGGRGGRGGGGELFTNIQVA